MLQRSTSLRHPKDLVNQDKSNPFLTPERRFSSLTPDRRFTFTPGQNFQHGGLANKNYLTPNISRSSSGAKDVVLHWVQRQIQHYPISVTNFSSCWNDGLAFCALIHSFYSEAFDWYALSAENPQQNFTLAFQKAEELADICPVLDVEDMLRFKNPDWKCVFTYVSLFYRRFCQGKTPPPPEVNTSTASPASVNPAGLSEVALAVAQETQEKNTTNTKKEKPKASSKMKGDVQVQEEGLISEEKKEGMSYLQKSPKRTDDQSPKRMNEHSNSSQIEQRKVRDLDSTSPRPKIVEEIHLSIPENKIPDNKSPSKSPKLWAKSFLKPQDANVPDAKSKSISSNGKSPFKSPSKINIKSLIKDAQDRISKDKTSHNKESILTSDITSCASKASSNDNEAKDKDGLEATKNSSFFTNDGGPSDSNDFAESDLNAKDQCNDKEDAKRKSKSPGIKSLIKNAQNHIFKDKSPNGQTAKMRSLFQSKAPNESSKSKGLPTAKTKEFLSCNVKSPSWLKIPSTAQSTTPSWVKSSSTDRPFSPSMIKSRERAQSLKLQKSNSDEIKENGIAELPYKESIQI